MKNPLTPAGIEPATFRFVAQHLNHCATAVLVHHLNTQVFMKRFSCIYVEQSSRWGDVLDAKVMHEKHTIQTACTEGLRDDEHMIFETCRRHKELD